LCGPDLRLWIWHGRRGFDEFLGSRNRETAEKADFLDVDQQTAYVLWQHDFSRKFVLGIFDPNQKLQSQRACRFVVNNLFADADADDVLIWYSACRGGECTKAFRAGRFEQSLGPLLLSGFKVFGLSVKQCNI
jgi:hypothetical protein